LDKLVARPLEAALESRHPSKNNGGHKQKSGQHTLARQKTKKINYLSILIKINQDWTVFHSANDG
jgi:hypothetical protein